jgi:hypothetical protein
MRLGFASIRFFLGRFGKEKGRVVQYADIDQPPRKLEPTNSASRRIVLQVKSVKLFPKKFGGKKNKYDVIPLSIPIGLADQACAHLERRVQEYTRGLIDAETNRIRSPVDGALCTPPPRSFADGSSSPFSLPASVDDQPRPAPAQHTPRVEKRLENLPCEDHQEGGGSSRPIAIIDDLGLGIRRERDMGRVGRMGNRKDLEAAGPCACSLPRFIFLLT